MKQKDETRRSFIKNILAGSAVAAVTAVSAKSARATKKTLPEKRTDEILYRETEDFKRYYETL